MVERVHYYEYTSFSAVEAAVVAERFASSDREELDVSQCQLGDQGLQTLVNAFAAVDRRNLKRLNLAYNRLHLEGVRALCSLLATTPALEWLDLGGNMLGDHSLALMVAALSTPTSARLRTLRLAGTHVQDDGARSLATWLRRPDCPLQHLDLFHTHVGSSGMRSICNAVAGTNFALQDARWVSGIGEVIARNKVLATRRRPRCRAACVLLMGIKRGGLSKLTHWAAKEVVQLIARMVWQQRHSERWDTQEERKRKQPKRACKK